MKYILVILSFFLIFGAFNHDVLINHAIPAPTDTLIGLYHPFIDLFSPEFPRGVPFKNSLITDPIRQQIPWKLLVTESWNKLQLPLWNPYSFGGTPLLANFQSGSFYFFGKLFFFLPFIPAWMIYILSQPILAAWFMFLFLRSIKISHSGSFFGSIIFAFCGFSIAWLEWGNVVHTLLWLPLILFTIEKMIEKMRWQYAVLFVFASVMAFFAGHLQVWFYGFVLSNVYFMSRLYSVKEKKKLLVTFLSLISCLFLLSLVQLIPTLQFILNSARDVDQSWMTPGWFLPFQNLVQFIAPDYFGNPATGNYWGIWNYGEFIGYISVGGLLFSMFGMMSGFVKKSFYAVFFTAVALVSFIFMVQWPLSELPFWLHLPFISSSQPTRLMAIVDLSLAILAAIGWDSISGFSKKQKYIILGIFMSLFVISWISILALPHLPITIENISVAKRNLIPSTIFLALILISFAFLNVRNKIIKDIGMIACIIIIAFDLIRFGTKFESFSPQNYFYPQTKVISYLQQHIKNGRIMVLDDRILPPNANAYYHIQSISGYDPLYSLRYAQFISMMERNKPDISSPFGFNRIITPKNYKSPLMDLLGVRYLLTIDPITDPRFALVLSEGDTKVYINTEPAPRVFFIHQSIAASNPDHAAHMLSGIDNVFGAAAVEGLSSQTFSQGNALDMRYSSNTITVRTENPGRGFLVLTDSYYPSWKAFVDGKETKIYPTDITFRGIIVPAGNHIITFQDNLF